MEEEHLRAAMPPDWREGMSWAVEGKAFYDSDAALDEQGAFNAGWAGEIEFRVVEVDGLEAIVDAHIRLEASNHAPCSWLMRYSMEPFGLVSAHTEGLTRDVETSDYVLDEETYWEWPTPILEVPQAPDAIFYRQWFMRARFLPRVSFDAEGIWLERPTSSYLGTERLTRRTLWRAGDPWFAITEALDEHGRPSQTRSPPARFRLIEIDGERIEPVPWSEGHRR